MLKITQFVVNPFGESTFVVADEATGDAIVVDPGMATPDELDAFDKFIADNKLKITGIVNTHMHLDHCFGANHVRDKYGVTVAAHPDDAPLGSNIGQQAAKFGMKLADADVAIDVPLHDGDTITVGNEKLQVIHTPGHSAGSICLYSPDGKFLIAGDTLFAGAVGRTDILGGNHAQLLDSIRRRLFTLPDDTLVIPGHGRTTTIGHEKATNPFFH